MNSEATVARLLDAGAVLTVQEDRLLINTRSALPDEVLNILRRDRSEIIERWQERAAIREIDGGYQKAKAKSLASKGLLCLDSDCRS